MWWNMPYQDGGQWMGGWGWWMPFHGIVSLLFLVLLVVGAVALVRTLWGGGHAGHGRRSPGLDLLEERYARGEIGREEYLQKKRDLGG